MLAHRRALPYDFRYLSNTKQPLTHALPTPRRRHVSDARPPIPRAISCAISLPAPLQGVAAPNTPPLTCLM
ncbi:hypothetical protein FB107DRAFT_267149, partial [Schizophyllum commune]